MERRPDISVSEIQPQRRRRIILRRTMSTKMFRAGSMLAALALVAAACGPATNIPSAAPSGSAGASQPATSASAAGVVDIRWYCCLGTGENPEQLPVEQKVVDAFNASHPNIKLKFEVVTYDAARNTLATQIASGNGPDIVGPVGVGGGVAFNDQWLDLGPLIEKTSYDITQYDPGAVDFYKIGDVQDALPFAIYPSMLFYKADLFKEAGLNPPPHKYGEKYKMPDGTAKDWNYDTIKEIGLKLTVDKNGKDATEAGFDPKSIVQYGFEPYRDLLPGTGAYFGPGSLMASDGKTVEIPPAWADAWKYWYDGMWNEHFIMTGPVYESEEFGAGEYAFFSGRVAMSNNFLWTTYGVHQAGEDWDLAAVPSHNGKVTSPLNADTFRILKDTKHPDEAFEVLQYLLGEGSGDLLGIYGGMPARTADQDKFFEGLDQQKDDAGKIKFPQGVDWQVAKDSVQYADNPNFEAFVPKYNETLDALTKYETKWVGTGGLTLDTEIEALKKELQALWGG
jgi:multiple sugar transport system substrate-binding protein